MAEDTLAQYGANLELIEETTTNEVFIENTATGTRISLGDYLNIVGGLGDSGDPVPGASYFESVSTDAVNLRSSLLNNKSLVDTVSVSNAPVDATVSLSGSDTAGYLIDVGGFFDSSTSDTLDLTVGGVSTSDYDWTEEDSDGGYSVYTDQSEFRLADSNANFNSIRGAWLITKPRSRVRIAQIFATHGQLGSRPVLYDGEITAASNLDSITLSTSSDMSNFSADIVEF